MWHTVATNVRLDWTLRLPSSRSDVCICCCCCCYRCCCCLGCCCCHHSIFIIIIIIKINCSCLLQAVLASEYVSIRSSVKQRERANGGREEQKVNLDVLSYHGSQNTNSLGSYHCSAVGGYGTSRRIFGKNATSISSSSYGRV